MKELAGEKRSLICMIKKVGKVFGFALQQILIKRSQKQKVKTQDSIDTLYNRINNIKSLQTFLNGASKKSKSLLEKLKI
jgi:hypothetical protein